MSTSDLSPVAVRPVTGPPFPPEVVVHRNAVVGETMLVHRRAVGGRVLRVEILIEAVHHAPIPHIHPRSSETFTVVEGEMGIRAGRRRWVMKAGESFAVLPGVVHQYSGVPGRTARVVVDVDPAGRMEEFFASVYTSPLEERDPRTGHPKLSFIAALLLDHADDVGVPFLPAVLARPLLRVLAMRSVRTS